MDNFSYINPTRIVFGKGSIGELRNLVPTGRVLLTYGGGSIFRNGVYAQAKAALAGRDVLEFGGIPPNPVYEHLMEAVKIVKERKVDFLLAVGGGSVLDGTKFIAAAVHHDGADPWDILVKSEPVRGAVPLGSVLTLAATGSESNGFAVISRTSTKEKLAFGSERCYPRFAILDPTVTYSLPRKQVRNGIVDAFIHVMEQYATQPVRASLQDRQAEAILRTLIEEGPATLERPEDYDARANLVWCATQALNGLIGCGVPQDWATHMIGHEVTALYGLDHAETLAIVLPSLLGYQKERKAAKLRQYASRVWGIDGGGGGWGCGGEKGGGGKEGDGGEGSGGAAGGGDGTIDAAIAKTREFFESLDMPTRLRAYGIAAAEAASRVAERFRSRGTRIGEGESLGAEDVERILQAC
jgi:NADP-dependent alcohol dehydrogenase